MLNVLQVCRGVFKGVEGVLQVYLGVLKVGLMGC